MRLKEAQHSHPLASDLQASFIALDEQRRFAPSADPPAAGPVAVRIQQTHAPPLLDLPAVLLELVVRNLEDKAAFRLTCMALNRNTYDTTTSLTWRLINRLMAPSAHGPDQPWPVLSLNALPTALFARCSSLRTICLRGLSATRDLTPLASLTALHGLDIRNIRISDLASLTALRGLTSLNCRRTRVSDLTPLLTLAALASLDCSHTNVKDLTGLPGGLQALNCSNSKASSLRQLVSLTGLTSLKFSETKVRDLAPVAAMLAMARLDFSVSRVSDLAPLAGMTGLTALNCSYTNVSDLKPIAAMAGLTSLKCSGTCVADLTPLAGLTALTLLTCSARVLATIDLAPLAALTGLRSLECRGGRRLAPLAALTGLIRLDCFSWVAVDAAPLTAMKRLISFNGNPVPGSRRASRHRA